MKQYKQTSTGLFIVHLKDDCTYSSLHRQYQVCRGWVGTNLDNLYEVVNLAVNEENVVVEWEQGPK